MAEQQKPEIPRERRRERLRLAIAYGIAVCALLWVFHGIDVRGFFKYILKLDYAWIPLAVAADIATYICQGWRWKLLLHPVGKVSIFKTTEATYAGLFASEVVPLRFGELVRAYLISCWMPAEFPAVLPSIVVERLFDGVWVAVGVGLVVSFIPVHGWAHTGAIILLVGIGLAVAAFAYAVYSRRSRLADERTGRSIHSKTLRTLVSFLVHIAQGLRQIGLSRGVYLALFLTLAMLLLQALAFWCLVQGFHLKIGVLETAAVFMIMRLGTALPSAPANVGTWQGSVVFGLSTVFGVSKTQAAGFSVVAFVLLTAPLWIIGFLAFLESEATLLEIRKEIDRLMEHHGRKH